MHLGFALISRIYDGGAHMQLLGGNINGENKLSGGQKGRNRAAAWLINYRKLGGSACYAGDTAQ